jgi:hypothetical protein
MAGRILLVEDDSTIGEVLALFGRDRLLRVLAVVQAAFNCRAASTTSSALVAPADRAASARALLRPSARKHQSPGRFTAIGDVGVGRG